MPNCIHPNRQWYVYRCQNGASLEALCPLEENPPVNIMEEACATYYNKKEKDGT